MYNPVCTLAPLRSSEIYTIMLCIIKMEKEPSLARHRTRLHYPEGSGATRAPDQRRHRNRRDRRSRHRGGTSGLAGVDVCGVARWSSLSELCWEGWWGDWGSLPHRCRTRGRVLSPWELPHAASSCQRSDGRGEGRSAGEQMGSAPAASRPQRAGPHEREDGVSGSSAVQSLPLLLRGLERGRAALSPECRAGVAWGASPFLGCGVGVCNRAFRDPEHLTGKRSDRGPPCDFQPCPFPGLRP